MLISSRLDDDGQHLGAAITLALAGSQPLSARAAAVPGPGAWRAGPAAQRVLPSRPVSLRLRGKAVPPRPSGSGRKPRAGWPRT